MIGGRQPWAFAVALAAVLWAEPAAAGTLVEFPNNPGQVPATLRGYLARPDLGLSAILGRLSGDAKRYPAVVVLHGCGGLSSHAAEIADRIGSWGYTALAIDSLATRGIPTRCGIGRLLDQTADAYAAFRCLSRLDFVDASRVAVLGNSMGGSAVLDAVDRNSAAQDFTERFRAAVAYYPGCSTTPSPVMTAPTLILIGEADELNSAELCQAMVEHARPEGAPITLMVYPGVHHAFDIARFDPGISFLGGRLEYNRAAATDAEAKVRAFLAAHLREASGGAVHSDQGH